MDNTVGSQQHNIIAGTLLGDGLLERNGTYVRLVIDHSAKQRTYVRWLADELASLQPTIINRLRFDVRTNRTYSHCILRTRTSPSLEKYVALFYQERRKRVPQILPQLMNPQLLAVLIMDDGYRRNDCQALRLNTQSYHLGEQRVIQRALKKLSVESTIQKHKTQHVVYIPSKAMPRLRTLVRPHLITSMKYKLA